MQPARTEAVWYLRQLYSGASGVEPEIGSAVRKFPCSLLHGLHGVDRLCGAPQGVLRIGARQRGFSTTTSAAGTSPSASAEGVPPRRISPAWAAPPTVKARDPKSAPKIPRDGRGARFLSAGPSGSEETAVGAGGCRRRKVSGQPFEDVAARGRFDAIAVPYRLLRCLPASALYLRKATVPNF